MRRLIANLLILGAAVAAEAAPAVRWSTEVYDFGAFSEDDGPRTARFVLYNDGDESMAIMAARATCGCTTPKYRREAIMPGDSTVVEVTYDPGGRPGHFAKKVYIETNTEPSRSTLSIRGTVIGAPRTVERRFPVDMGPLRLSARTLMIGEVTRGHLKTVYLDAYNASADSLRVDVLRKPEWLDITVSPVPANPGEQLTLIAYANTARCDLYGLVEDSLTLRPAGGQAYTLPVTMIVNEDFGELTPERLAKAPVAQLGATTLDPGTIGRDSEPVHLSFDIANAGRDVLRIRRIFSADPAVTVKCKESSVKSGKRARVDLTLDPSAIRGDMLNARITVITNDPLHPVQTVRVAALMRK